MRSRASESGRYAVAYLSCGVLSPEAFPRSPGRRFHSADEAVAAWISESWGLEAYHKAAAPGGDLAAGLIDESAIVLDGRANCRAVRLVSFRPCKPGEFSRLPVCVVYDVDGGRVLSEQFVEEFDAAGRPALLSV